MKLFNEVYNSLKIESINGIIKQSEDDKYIVVFPKGSIKYKEFKDITRALKSISDISFDMKTNEGSFTIFNQPELDKLKKMKNVKFKTVVVPVEISPGKYEKRPIKGTVKDEQDGDFYIEFPKGSMAHNTFQSITSTSNSIGSKSYNYNTNEAHFRVSGKSELDKLVKRFKKVIKLKVIK